MMMMKSLFAVTMGSALIAMGCGPTASTTQNEKSPTTAKEKAKPEAKTEKTDDHAKGDAQDHSGWWCAEHGIPEAECSMCSAKVARRCKAKGDWCHDHDRAKSQCFICDPKLKEKYAAVYRAKEGKEPPPIEEAHQPKASPPDKTKG